MKRLPLLLALVVSGCGVQNAEHLSMDRTLASAPALPVVSEPAQTWHDNSAGMTHPRSVNEGKPVDPNSFASFMVLFQSVRPDSPMPGSAAAASIATPTRTPYARPDLSDDPQERERGARVQTAILHNDFQVAQSLVTTNALQELVNEGLRSRAANAQAEQISADADKEPASPRTAAREP